VVFGALSCRVGLAAGWYAVCLPGFCPLVVVEAYGWGVGPLQGGGGTGRNASIDGWWGAMRTLPAPVGLFVLAVATVSALVAGAALMGVPAAQAAAGTSPYTTLSVQVGFGPYGVAVNEATDTVYVANHRSSTVSVIDGATNTVTATANASAYPDGVAVDDTTDTIYAANYDSISASVIIPASVSVSPTSGPAGTSVTVSGRGFNPGETVNITYKTRLASPKSVTICSATAGSDTTYTCSGTVPPPATAGANGSHKFFGQRSDLGHQSQDHLHPHLTTSPTIATTTERSLSR
jgi:YVTN family beta-propeller protein